VAAIKRLYRPKQRAIELIYNNKLLYFMSVSFFEDRESLQAGNPEATAKLKEDNRRCTKVPVARF
jgi:hypothetical protein